MAVVVGMGAWPVVEEIEKEENDLESKERILVYWIRKHVNEIFDLIDEDYTGEEQLQVLQKFLAFLGKNSNDLKWLLDKLIDIEKEIEKAEIKEEMSEESEELEALSDLLV